MRDRREENINITNEKTEFERRPAMPRRECSERPPMPPKHFEDGQGREREKRLEMQEDLRFRGPRERQDERSRERFPGSSEQFRSERRRPPMGRIGSEMRPPMGPPPGQGVIQSGAFPPPQMTAYGYMPYMPVMMVPVMVVPVVYPGMIMPMMPPMGGPGAEMRPPMPPMSRPGMEMKQPVPSDEKSNAERAEAEKNVVNVEDNNK